MTCDFKVVALESYVDIRVSDPGVKLRSDYHFSLEIAGTRFDFRVPAEKWAKLYDGSSIPQILSMGLGQRLDSPNLKTGTPHDAMWDGVVEVNLVGGWTPVWFSTPEADAFYRDGHRFLGRPRIAVINWLGVRIGSGVDAAKGWLKINGPSFARSWFRDDPEYIQFEAFAGCYPDGVQLSWLTPESSAACHE